jgi:hypothetical protein
VVTGLIVLSVGSIPTALLVLAANKVRQEAERTQSMGDLKQITLAAICYHDVYRCLPFNGTQEPYDQAGVKVGGPARPAAPFTGSWVFPSLPYIDSLALWNLGPDPAVGINVFHCHGRGRPVVCTKGVWTDYMINAWLNDHRNGSVFARDMKRTLRDISDGTANTIFAGHGSIDPDLYASNVPGPHSCEIFKGGETGTARNLTTNHRDTAGDGRLDWGSPFAKGTVMGICDGTVRMFPYSVSGGIMIPGKDGATATGVGSGLAPFLTPTGREQVVMPN